MSMNLITTLMEKPLSIRRAFIFDIVQLPRAVLINLGLYQQPKGYNPSLRKEGDLCNMFFVRSFRENGERLLFRP